MELGPILRSMTRNKARFGLLVVEIALTLAIVTNCIGAILEVRRQQSIPSGFDDDNLMQVRVVPFDRSFDGPGAMDNRLAADLELLRHTDGVRGVTNCRFLPWVGGGSSTELRVAGATDRTLYRTQQYAADEATLATLGARLAAGRNFTRDDVDRDTARLRELFENDRPRGADGLPARKFQQDVLISRAYARLMFGTEDALGKLLEDRDGDMYRVIGLVDRFYNPYGWPIHEYVMFYANRTASFDGGVPLLVRSAPGRLQDVAKRVEERLLAAHPGRTVTIRTIPETKAQYFSGRKLTSTLMGGVIVALVLVTSLGIVGLTSFSVTERTRQIGARRALGARRADVLRYFLTENGLLTTLGLTLGVALSIGLNVFLVRAVEAPKLDFRLLIAGVLLLWVAGLLAALAPSLRASRIPPAIATRNV